MKISSIILVAVLVSGAGYAVMKEPYDDPYTIALRDYDEALAKVGQEAKRAEEAESRNRALATLACQKAILAQTKFPTKANFDPGFLKYAQVGRLESDPEAVAVRGRVELMNGLGNMIPHTYASDIKDGIILYAGANPG